MRGFVVEHYAADQLTLRGLQLVARNFQTRFGEIDLIMWDQAVLVFVEVRYRRHSRFGDALDSVTPAKQQRLIRTADIYLQHKQLSCACRFDIVGVTGPRHARHIDWIRHAFDAC